MSGAKRVPVRRVHAGYYVSREPGERWTFLRRGSHWELLERGGRKETFGTLADARYRAAFLDAERAARRRPSTAPEVERLRIERLPEHADHFRAVDERGRVMSTGPLAALADAVAKHWPFASVEVAT